MEWTPLTPGMYADLDGTYWIATRYGRVCMADYEWQQGHEPDGFNVHSGGRYTASDITHVIPVTIPEHPTTGVK